MRLGGLRACSFIDFPGRLAAVVFTQGCNLRCPWCHNPDLVTGPPPAGAPDWPSVLALLQTRQGKLGGVVLTGGEPTLQEGLTEACRALRRLGLAIKLDTNGTRPQVLAALLDAGLVDHVALDVKSDPAGYPEVTARPDCDTGMIGQCLDLLRRSPIEHEVRTTLIGGHHDPPRLERLAAWIHGVRVWAVQGYRPGRTLDGGFAGQAPSPSLIAAATAAAASRGIPCRVR